MFVADKIPRFLENLFLNAEIREGNGLEYMVNMWEGRGDVEVPLRSRQGRKDDVQVHLLGCKALKKRQKKEGEGAEEVNGGGRHSLLPSGRCRIVGGDRVKSGHVTTGKGEGKYLCQGPSWPQRKRAKKSARRSASSAMARTEN